MRRGICQAGLGVAAALALGAGAAPANAVERFAAPDGVPSAACLIATPCDIQSAVEGAVASDVDAGDVVTLLPGSTPYVAGAAADDIIRINKDIDVRGQPGAARPVLTSGSSEGGVSMQTEGASLKRLEIVHDDVSDGNDPALLLAADVDVEQVMARSKTGHVAAAGCAVSITASGKTPLIRDSICTSAHTSGAAGVRVKQTSALTSATTVTLRNVTAIGGAVGITIDLATSSPAKVNATGVIASGPTDDVVAVGISPNSELSFTHSNYDDVNTGTSNITVTPAGTGTNQTLAPVFVDAAGGDFHQASNSPTIDNGSSAAGLGSGDIDGEPRCMGSVPDIGADEFTLASCDLDGDGVPNINDACPNEAGPVSNAGCQTTTPPDETSPDNSPGDTKAPQTSITKGPKARISSTKTLFRFASNEPGSRFECKLDKARWKACRPPQKLTGLDRGKHSFRVRAIDAAGNVDKSPARRNFKIESKRKRR